MAWSAYCAANPRLRDPKALPAMVRRGVPEDLRAEVWAHCLGVVLNSRSTNAAQTEQVSEAQREEQDKAPEVVEPDQAKDDSPASMGQSLRDVIEADVCRTFPICPVFQGMNGPDRLRQVLWGFAELDPDLGYCQSINFLAAIFIMVLLDDSVAVTALQQLLTKLGTRRWYMDGMLQLRGDTAVLEQMLDERAPALLQAMRKHRFDLLFVTSKWFLCLFVTVLEGEALRRVWDVMLCDGIEVVFRVSFAMMWLSSDAIVKARSMDDLIHLFQDWRLTCSPEELIQRAYDPTLLGPVHRSELAQRRKKAVEAISASDLRSEMTNQQFWRGGVRPASILARRG